MSNLKSYLQDEGAHFATDAVQVQDATALESLVDCVGVKVTTKSFVALMVPETVTIPELSPTDIEVARPVGVKPLLQLLKLLNPFVDTASVTHVLALLAAKITSDALARAV